MLGTQLSSIFCAYPHLPVQDQPHAWHPRGPHPSQAGPASLETHRPQGSPIPRPSAKKQVHTGVSLARSFNGRAGRPQSTAMSHAWGQSLVLLSAGRAEAAGPVVSPQALLCLLSAPPVRINTCAVFSLSAVS